MKTRTILFSFILLFILSSCEYLSEEEDYFPNPEDAPSITGVTNEYTGGPYEDGIFGGFIVSIQGKRFTTPEDMTVIFGSRNAEIISSTETEIKVKSPIGPLTSGKVDVKVATSGGIAILEEGYEYRYDDYELFEDEVGHIDLSRVDFGTSVSGYLFGLLNEFPTPRLVTAFNNYGYVFPSSAEDRPASHGEMVLQFDHLMDEVVDGEVYLSDDPKVRIAPFVNYDYAVVPFFSPEWMGESISFSIERDFLEELGEPDGGPFGDTPPITLCTEDEIIGDYSLTTWDSNTLQFKEPFDITSGTYLFGALTVNMATRETTILTSGSDLTILRGSDEAYSDENLIYAKYDPDEIISYTKYYLASGKFREGEVMLLDIPELDIDDLPLVFPDFIETVHGSLDFYYGSSSPHKVIWKAPVSPSTADANYLIISFIYFLVKNNMISSFIAKVNIFIDESSEDSNFFYRVLDHEGNEWFVYTISPEIVSYLPDPDDMVSQDSDLNIYVYGAISRHSIYSLNIEGGDILIDLNSIEGITSVSFVEGDSPECADGIDNDGDGDIDFPEDVDCGSLRDGSETD